MDFIQKNIHMENCKAKGNIQTALEEDVNLAENKEDIDKILLTRGKIKIEEIKTATSHAYVKGKIQYDMLYHTLEEMPVQSISGNLSFYEDIYMNGLENGDQVNVEAELEDISVHVINSRKLNIRALILFTAQANEIREEEVCEDIEDRKDINCQKQNYDYLELALQKKDIFRIRDEIELPKNLPNINAIIWRDDRVQNVSWQLQEDKIYLKGEVDLFVLYEPEQYSREEDSADKKEPVWYETRIPFQGELSCQGCKEQMISNLQLQPGNESIEMRQDADQENRNLGIDISLDLQIQLYESKMAEFITDAYSTSCEIVCTQKNIPMKKLVLQKTENVILQEKIPLPEEEDIIKLCYGNGTVHLEETSPEKEENRNQTENTTINGYLRVEILYEVKENEDGRSYGSLVADYPFSVQLDVKETGNTGQIQIMVMPQEFNVMLQGNEMEMKAIIHMMIQAYCSCEECLVSEITAQPLDYDKIKDMPGMLIYFVEKGDSLWQIGKKYYMDVDKIKKLNQMKEDNLKAGDKLLLIKEFSSAL